VSNKKIVVIGGSAGSLEPLRELIAALTTDLQASVLVVTHIPPWFHPVLPEIWNGKSPLPLLHPVSGQAIDVGKIYVAAPDHHMIIEDSKVELWRGPKEDRHRPSINVLFRSAAATWGKDVIGVILSGLMEDGAAGLHWIEKHGGTTIVQDPATCTERAMPEAALQYVKVDYVLEPKAIGPMLVRLTRTKRPSKIGPNLQR
jgi:two-component system chemotaxis response regulator CheB